MTAKRKDANHNEIAAAFEACGFKTFDTSALGKGFPDIVVYRPSHGVLLVEVKDGAKSPSKRRLTAAEAEFAEHFPVFTIESVDEVLLLANMEAIQNAAIEVMRDQ